MRPTQQEMRAIERHIELAQQVKKIRKIMIKSYAYECDECGLEFVPFYTKNGLELCPHCDAEEIENL